MTLFIYHNDNNLKVTLENEDGDEEEVVHKVSQLHLTSWPDHGVRKVKNTKYKVKSKSIS